MQPARHWQETAYDDGFAIRDLARTVSAFLETVCADLLDPATYHDLVAVMHSLLAAILRCEREGRERAEIMRVVEPVRRVCSLSPFVRRLQLWPRGYAGDFETIEMLCTGPRPRHDSLEELLETYALTRAIAQQFGNRVQHQSNLVLEVLQRKPGEARILSMACGGSLDLRRVAPALQASVGELWLNDADPDALSVSREALGLPSDRCRPVPGNAVRVAARLARERPDFDLVLVGGLFDYLPERWVVSLIRKCRRLLANDGTLFFSNIAKGNPYRPLIEYVADWFLIERTEDEIRACCEAAGVPAGAVDVRRDATGLSLLVSITS